MPNPGAKRKARSPTSSRTRPDLPQAPSSVSVVLHPSHTRPHPRSYHSPPLLEDGQARGRLLEWFEEVREKRGMPWRKKWEDRDETALAQRAYEVWVSEIMLQQTRVETVIDYYNRWMTAFPTMNDLAQADPESVLSHWRGLGYYSRATRLHASAKRVVEERHGKLPMDPIELEKGVGGVGRYTAGAICSIAYDVPTPILDGNIQRVLSRQMALYSLPKSKATTDLLWDVADQLVKSLSAGTGVSTADGQAVHAGGADKRAVHEKATKGRRGDWNQALMELGSTLCTPQKPSCDTCPIADTCRAYLEATALADQTLSDSSTPVSARSSPSDGSVSDIEDLCSLCEPFPFTPSPTEPSPNDTTLKKRRVDSMNKIKEAVAPAGSGKQTTLLSFRFSSSSAGASAATAKDAKAAEASARARSALIATHVTKYPMRVEKKKQREEEGNVCCVEWIGEGDGRSRYLLVQRPPSGLLASLFEFPTAPLSTATPASPTSRSAASLAQLTKLFDRAVVDVDGRGEGLSLLSRRRLGSVVHVFSHIRMTYHLEHVTLSGASAGGRPPDVVGQASDGEALSDDSADEPSSPEPVKKPNRGGKRGRASASVSSSAPPTAWRWATAAEVDEANMGTGLRRCWELVKASKGRDVSGRATSTKRSNGVKR